MSYFYTSESVSEGHPDKIADQISDALLDEFLRVDKSAKVACETLVTTGLVFIAGEVRTKGYVEVQDVVRNVIRKIGYTKPEYQFDANSCGIISAIHEQSGDIYMGVTSLNPEDMGAGDQGIMYGYACRETDDFMPLPVELAHIFLQQLAFIRKNGHQMTYLRPDSKSQITIEYDNNRKPVRVDTILISTQHDEFASEDKMQKIIKKDIQEILIKHVVENILPADEAKLFAHDNYKLIVNPTGKFVIGGPHGDTGLTGRKIVVDTYGGRCPHGGGCFSGKDATKVDRSGTYAMRHLAKNMVAAGIADEVLVQISYGIGIAKPISLYVFTYNTGKVKDKNGNILHDGKIAEILYNNLDFRPYHIIKHFNMLTPIYFDTASYGHFGRNCISKEVEVYYQDEDTYEKTDNGKVKFFKNTDFFPWEKLDYVEKLKQLFNL